MNMMLQSRVLEQFSCLGENCPDTCCKGWTMQLSSANVEFYREKAPELLSAVVTHETPHMMKRDAQTDYCVKFSSGLCGIHRDYGESFLGDACHFYPRSTRALGEKLIQSAALSCPEVVRLALYTSFNADDMQQIDAGERLPSDIRNYLPETMEAEAAIAVHQAFLAATQDSSASPEQSMLRIVSVSESLTMLSHDIWQDAISFYLRSAGTRLPLAVPDAADPFNLLNIFIVLVAASSAGNSSRLHQTLAEMQSTLAVTIDAENNTLITSEASLRSWHEAVERWKNDYSTTFAPLLRRYLGAQISLNLFPFAGLGETLRDRSIILALRLATMKQALISLCYTTGKMPEQQEIIRVIQSVSRFSDHLANGDASLALYSTVGWTKLARLRGLLEV
jgi:lysine-N-methylase